MVSKINGKAFHHSIFFNDNKKRKRKIFIVKCIQKVHNFTVVRKYKNLFLQINLKRIQFCLNVSVQSLHKYKY